MRKKLFFSIAILFTALILFLLTYNFRAEQEQFFSDYRFTESEIAKLNDGDIILRHGYGLVSDIIVETLKENFEISHCAIIVKDGKNPIKVIHSVSQSVSDFDGVQEQSLETFVHQSQKNSIMVVRFKGSDEDRKLISKKAVEYLEKKIPFDHNFDISDEKEFYCQELIWKIINDEIHVDIFPDRVKKSKKYLEFANFYNPQFFEIIIDHHKK